MAKERICDTYEQVAQFLLNEFADHFGLERVEEKQAVIGLRSGTEWTIDCKGIKKNNDGFLIVECRRHTTNKQKQEQVGALAYRIIDTGAKGGIIVSVLGIQEGGKAIAEAEGIVAVHLDADSTTTDYVMKFLDKVMIGRSLEDTLHIEQSLSCIIETKQPDGSLTVAKKELEAHFPEEE